MRVRVDQAGGDDAVPMVFDDAPIGGHIVLQRIEHPLSGAHMHHSAAGHRDGAIEHHRSGDGNNQRRAVQRHRVERLRMRGQVQGVVKLHDAVPFRFPRNG